MKHQSKTGHDTKIQLTNSNHEDHSIGQLVHDHSITNHNHHDAEQSHLNHEQNEPPHQHHSPTEHSHMDQQHSDHDHHTHMVRDFKKRFIISILLLIPILLLSPMIQELVGLNFRFAGDLYLLLLLCTILFVYGGYPFIQGMLEEMKQKSPSMMSLISLAITVAYLYSTYTVIFASGQDFFWELSTLISIMLFGHWIEMKSILGASKALEELLKLMPSEAHLVDEQDHINDIPVEDVKVGMHLLVKPGEKVPVDGQVIEGRSAVNEAMLTGESIPVSKALGSELIGGSINTDGSLKLIVTRVGSDTFLSQVIQLVKEAQSTRSRTQRVADLAAKYLFYIALIGGIATFTTWMILGEDIGFAMERAVTVIIISCPHALGLATPLVTAVSSSIGAKHGLLIRNRANFENARKINAVVFDKTGTLTQGEFGITSIKSFHVTDQELLSLAYTIENKSEHPIAKAIVTKAQTLQLNLLQAVNVHAVPGKGMVGEINHRLIEIVSPGYLEEQHILFDRHQFESLATEGNTVVYVLSDRQLLGYIAMSDVIRDTSFDAVNMLHRMGIDTYMLTGDNHRVADEVARKIGIKHVFAEVLPDQKAAKIEMMTKSEQIVAMTGDGINDAPALAKAHLGIAIGAGTDVAIETADVILVKSNPMDVVNIIKLSKSTYQKMLQNLMWATGYNIVAIPLAAGVLSSYGIVLSPALGAVLMSLSTVVVAINARMLKL